MCVNKKKSRPTHFEVNQVGFVIEGQDDRVDHELGLADNALHGECYPAFIEPFFTFIAEPQRQAISLKKRMVLWLKQAKLKVVGWYR